jgi:Core-2/I-Branching enzyme
VTIAYVISAYKLPSQLVRLVRRLEAPGASFVVHVDRKTDERVNEEMVAGLADLDSIHFLPRHACHWGGFGHVRATLKGIDHLVCTGTPFEYLVLLTGQDYPLVDPDRIERHLEAVDGRSFMSYWPLPHEPWAGRGGLDRIERWHWIRGRRLRLSLPLRRRVPGNLRPYGGSPYWCLARPVVEYIHAFVHANPGYVRFFEHVFVPDEIFFQTIVLNSPLAETVVDDNLRYIDWTRVPAPTILEIRDFDVLATSGALFARKFDVTVDSEILDLLDQRLLTKAGPTA